LKTDLLPSGTKIFFFAAKLICRFLRNSPQDSLKTHCDATPKPMLAHLQLAAAQIPNRLQNCLEKATQPARNLHQTPFKRRSTACLTGILTARKPKNATPVSLFFRFPKMPKNTSCLL